MNSEHEMTPEQIVAVALAHDHIVTQMRADGVPPALSETLVHVRQEYGEEATKVCDAIGASMKSEKAIKGVVSLLALVLLPLSGRSSPKQR